MKWKDIKFWLWLEVDFPLPLEPTSSTANWLEDDRLRTAGPQDWSDVVGPQGPQGPQCGSEIPANTVCFELISFSSEFELNGIPTASVSVAIGRRADNVRVVSNIHHHVDELKLQLPARVWCLADTPAASHPADNDFWPAGKFKIFDGYLTGSGFRRGEAGAELILSLTHWLTDLNFSSAISRVSHPLNPAQMFMPASFQLGKYLAGGGFLTGTGPMLVGPHLAAPFFPSGVILTDFWGGIGGNAPNGSPLRSGLKDWLLTLTRFDRINAQQIADLAGSVAASSLQPGLNWEACRALSRFEPNASGPGFEENGYVLGVPTAMDVNLDLSAHIAEAIANDIGFEGLEAYTNTTLWDKLVGQFHANYMFSIVPLVEKALVVPFVPALSDQGTNALTHRIIRTSQYESVDLSASMPRPLRAVGVLLGKNFQAGFGVSNDQQFPYAQFGGWFDKMTRSRPVGLEPDPRHQEGMIIFREGPRWMSTIVPLYQYSAASAGIIESINTGLANAGIDWSFPEPAEILENSTPVWDLYARALYIHEALKGRQGVITGPVRFDIAPGSSIKIEMTEDRYVRKLVDGTADDECADASFNFFYCSILRVSTTIDCQNNRAFTTFYAAHIRDEQENKDRGTSISKHPLWQKCQWAGCVLVQDLAFAPLATKQCVEPAPLVTAEQAPLVTAEQADMLIAPFPDDDTVDVKV